MEDCNRSELLHEESNTPDVSGRMSLRLITVASMLGEVRDTSMTSAGKVINGTLHRYRCVADVGCDHGYVSIYLVQKNIAASAIAMDVRKGPLSMAETNIYDYGLSDRIKTRLSDGLSELTPGEADSLIIAGMGGKLMISILENKDPHSLGINTMILQPQSDLPEFRKYLYDKGYETEDERIIYDEGKYYFPMRIKVASENTSEVSIVSNINNFFKKEIPKDRALTLHFRFGSHNILRRDPTLKNYLLHGREVCTSVLSHLNSNTHKERYTELQEELKDIETILKLYE